MKNLSPDEAIVVAQIMSGAVAAVLICLQVFKLGRVHRILRYVTYFTIAVTVSGIAFGQYYAGTAPSRLRGAEEERPSAAIAGYTGALRLNPGDAELYFRRGRTDFSLKKYDDALRDFDRALEISPNNAQFLASRGIAYFSLHDFSKAEQDLTTAIQNGFRDPEVIMFTGLLAEDRENYAEAIKLFSEALTGNGLGKASRCSTLVNLGVSQMALKQYEAALVSYSRALEICESGDGDRENAFVDRGNANQASGNYDAAMSDWDDALKLDPSDPVVFRNRSAANRDSGRIGAAILDISRYLQLRPDAAYEYRVRADMYRQIGDLAGYERDVMKADELDRAHESKAYPTFRSPIRP